MHIEIETSQFPRLTAWHVRKILKWIDPVHLRGLDRIRLLEYEPRDADVSKQPPYLVGFLYCGAYTKAKSARPARISLYTRDLYFGIPRMLSFSPMARLKIAKTLAHEVGHHAAETGVYVSKLTPNVKLKKQLDSKMERAAAAYAAEVFDRLFTSFYFRIGKVFASYLSRHLLERGDRAHLISDFKRAAEFEFRAYMVDTDNIDAWQSYLQDRQALIDKTPSALTDAERLGYFIDE